MIHKGGNKTWMDFYPKPTDSKWYIPLTPTTKNCLKSIASSENNLHNCRNSNITKRQLEELKNLLIIQEYIKDVVTQGIKKALVVPSEVLLSEKTKEKKQVLSFISTYNPNNPKLFQLIRNLFGS